MLRSFRFSLRFFVPLVVALTVMAIAAVPLLDRLLLDWAKRDVDGRAQLIGATLEPSLRDAIVRGDIDQVTRLLNRATRDERLYAVAVCSPEGQLLARSDTFPATLACSATEHDVFAAVRDQIPTVQTPHLTLVPLVGADRLLVVHDLGYAGRRTAQSRIYLVSLIAVLGAIAALITVFVALVSWRGWISGVRGLLRGEGILWPFERTRYDVHPLVGDVRELLRDIEDERRIREDATVSWKPETLRFILHEQLSGDQIIVVSNREPYIHERIGDRIVVQRPASGLVTAVEPVMRACSGTWIAHGAGSADRETVDANDRVPVPPGRPSYTLRRLWLSKEEEQGYYYGFANEGLWPLCHIAHVRPMFRESDWKQYVAVNQRFADAVVAEATTEDPVVLVQDYHFALLPRMIRERLPRATILTFWHIPWPNPESFGICPWRSELLDGLLGSTILGFHTAYHGRNFIETVDRFLETRIVHEESTITYGGRRTRVQPYPISIHWPDEAPDAAQAISDARTELRERLGLPANHQVMLGVDRLDYTKGIVERLLAVEHLLATYPELVGKVTLVQIAAPSRSALEEYQAFGERVRAHAERINTRFAGKHPPAVVLLIEHHSAESVNAHYRGCEVCVVTSLHDGMNLVAKEFIAARTDEQGVLVLSRFAGAAGELVDALIVNPYHLEQTASALYAALTMSEAEQRERMRSLRALVRDFNIYRWAGRMLLDAARERRRSRIRERIRDAHGDVLERN